MRVTGAAEAFGRLYAAHLLADYFLQDDWQATRKADLRTPALAVHTGLVAWVTWLVAPWWVAVLHALGHAAIDTRRPLAWWRRFASQTVSGPAALPFSMAQDQAAHVLWLIGLAWFWAARRTRGADS